MHEAPKVERSSRRGCWVRRAAEAALWLAPCLVLTGGAQNPPDWVQQRHPGLEAPGAEPGAQNEGSPESEKRLRALNAERQKSLVADTNKLLKLAAELDAEVGHASTEAPTSEQLHKVAEIEKLAHSVREKMSTSVRGTPVFRPSFGVPPAN